MPRQLDGKARMRVRRTLRTFYSHPWIIGCPICPTSWRADTHAEAISLAHSHAVTIHAGIGRVSGINPKKLARLQRDIDEDERESRE